MALEDQELEDFLQNEAICHVATVCEDGSPHVVPVWFIWKNGQLYWQTGPDTTKAQNLQRDNRIMVSVGGRETVIMRGTTEIVDAGSLDFNFYKALWEKYPDHMFKKYEQGKQIYRVNVDDMQSWHYESNK